MITKAQHLRDLLIEHRDRMTPEQAQVIETVCLEGEAVRFECSEPGATTAWYTGFIVTTETQRARLVESTVATRPMIWLRREIVPWAGPGAEGLDLAALAIRVGEQAERIRALLDATPSPAETQLRQIVTTVTITQYALLALLVPTFGLDLLSMPQSRLDGLHVVTDRILKAAGLALQQERPILATDLVPVPPTEQSPPTLGGVS